MEKMRLVRWRSYLTRKLMRDTLRKIGFHFEIDNDSIRDSVMERMRKKLAGHRTLRIRLDKVEASILKRQKRIQPLPMVKVCKRYLPVPAYAILQR